MDLIEVKVPDIGDFDAVSVIELLAGPADAAPLAGVPKRMLILGGGIIGMAAEMAHGSCTDVPPARR